MSSYCPNSLASETKEGETSALMVINWFYNNIQYINMGYTFRQVVTLTLFFFVSNVTKMMSGGN